MLTSTYFLKKSKGSSRLGRSHASGFELAPTECFNCFTVDDLNPALPIIRNIP